jgi:hypothetical protein
VLAAATPAAAAVSPGPGVPAVEAPAAPLFQVLTLGGRLAVIDPANLLAGPAPLQYDLASLAVQPSGLAVSPAGQTFVVGTDGVTTSWLWQTDFATGAETLVGKIPAYVIADLAFDGARRLYALTDNVAGASSHSLLRLDTGTATAAGRCSPTVSALYCIS